MSLSLSLSVSLPTRPSPSPRPISEPFSDPLTWPSSPMPESVCGRPARGESSTGVGVCLSRSEKAVDGCSGEIWKNFFFLWINTDTIKEVYFLSADWIIKKFYNILFFLFYWCHIDSSYQYHCLVKQCKHPKSCLHVEDDGAKEKQRSPVLVGELISWRMLLPDKLVDLPISRWGSKMSRYFETMRTEIK